MREEKWYYVYILASGRNGTLYTGVTNDLVRRTWEHDQGNVEGFTSEYNVKLLVYYEPSAISPRPSHARNASSAGAVRGNQN
jgi:predicted GIY-YIG superfamily endonuclease